MGWVVEITPLARTPPDRHGYDTVCLIALITILFTLPNLIETVFRLTDPLQTESQFGPALSSFDAYKATYADSVSSRGPGRLQRASER